MTSPDSEERPALGDYAVTRRSPCWKRQGHTVCGPTRLSAFSVACVPRKHEPSAGPKLTWRQAPWLSTAQCGSAETPRRRSPADLSSCPTWLSRALRALVLAQAADRAKAGTEWVENNLVFCRRTGTPLTDHDVWLQFSRITEKAGLGTDWSPRELRHTFVSLLSDSGVPIEQIADAVGHASTWTTENVCRHHSGPSCGLLVRCSDRCSLVRRTGAQVKLSLPLRLPDLSGEFA